MFDLTGRVAVATGGGRGLGRAIAFGLSQAGARLVLGARSQAEIDDAAAEIGRQGGQAHAVVFDATRRADCQHLVDQAVARFGRIEIMVVNHGISIAEPAEEVREESFDAIMAVNLKGAFNCAQLAALQMMRQGSGGSIIAVSSTASLLGFRTLLAYGASKAGLDQMVRQMAIEWADRGIRVNAVNPGYTTHRVRGTEARHANPALEEEIRRMTPMARRGRPEEFVGPVVFLASDAASFITGVCLPVDGGYCAL